MSSYLSARHAVRMELPAASLASKVSPDVSPAEITTSPVASPAKRDKIDLLSPEKVASAIVNVLVQRGVVVKTYLEPAQVEELNARNMSRWRDREQQTGKKEPKPKPERLSPKPRQGDWWDAEVYLDGWTVYNITDLHRVLDPTVLHQDTIVWHKECTAENGRPAWRYCFEAAPPLSVAELRDKVHRMYTFAYEVERPAVGKKLEELRSRILRMEKIVYYDAEGLLGEERYELEKEGEWEDEEDGEEDVKEAAAPEEMKTPILTEAERERQKERQILFRQEARTRILEEKSVQIEELTKQVIALQAAQKEMATRMDNMMAASGGSSASPAQKKKKEGTTNMDAAQVQRDILRKKLEAKKRVQAEEEEARKNASAAGSNEEEAKEDQ